MTKVEIRTRLPRRNRNPSFTDCHPVGAGSPATRWGGRDGSAIVVPIDATNVATSAPYASARPAWLLDGAAMMKPAAAGPTTIVALNITWLSAMAAGSRSR